jgi:hypothetical protein
MTKLYAFLYKTTKLSYRRRVLENSICTEYYRRFAVFRFGAAFLTRLTAFFTVRFFGAAFLTRLTAFFTVRFTFFVVARVARFTVFRALLAALRGLAFAFAFGIVVLVKNLYEQNLST